LLADEWGWEEHMWIAGGLAGLVLICLLLAMAQTPPAIGK
jgi:sugar phosphate permease